MSRTGLWCVTRNGCVCLGSITCSLYNRPLNLLSSLLLIQHWAANGVASQLCQVRLTRQVLCALKCLILQGTEDWSNLATVSGGAKETITLTVLGKSLVKTVQDVAAMPFIEFATFYAVSPNLH